MDAQPLLERGEALEVLPYNNNKKADLPIKQKDEVKLGNTK